MILFFFALTNMRLLKQNDMSPIKYADTISLSLKNKNTRYQHFSLKLKQKNTAHVPHGL